MLQKMELQKEKIYTFYQKALQEFKLREIAQKGERTSRECHRAKSVPKEKFKTSYTYNPTKQLVANYVSEIADFKSQTGTQMQRLQSQIKGIKKTLRNRQD